MFFLILIHVSFMLVAIQVGYPVDPDARQNLITDYNRVLKYASVLPVLPFSLIPFSLGQNLAQYCSCCAIFVDKLSQVHVQKYT